MLGGATDAAAVSIENNHIRDFGPATESDNGTVVGIEVIRAESATIAGRAARSGCQWQWASTWVSAVACSSRDSGSGSANRRRAAQQKSVIQ